MCPEDPQICPVGSEGAGIPPGTSVSGQSISKQARNFELVELTKVGEDTEPQILPNERIERRSVWERGLFT